MWRFDIDRPDHREIQQAISFPGLAEFVAGDGNQGEGHLVSAIDPQGLARRGQRFLWPSLFQQDFGQVAPGGQKVRVQFERTTVIFFGVLKISQRVQGHTEVGMHVRLVRLYFQGLLQAVHGFLRSAQRTQRRPAVGIDFCRIRLQGQYIAVFADGFLQSASQPVIVGETETGSEGIRLEVYGAQVALDCGIVFLQGFIDDAEIVVVVGIVSIDLYRPADQVDGARALTCLLRDQPKQMQSVRLIRLGLQNLSV